MSTSAGVATRIGAATRPIIAAIRATFATAWSIEITTRRDQAGGHPALGQGAVRQRARTATIAQVAIADLDATAAASAPIPTAAVFVPARIMGREPARSDAQAADLAAVARRPRLEAEAASAAAVLPHRLGVRALPRHSAAAVRA